MKGVWALLGAFVVVGSVIAARPMTITEEVSAPCPSPWAPEVGRDKNVTQDGVTYHFQLQAGTFQPMGPSVLHTGRYNWNTVVDDMFRARMVGAYSYAFCTYQTIGGQQWTIVTETGFEPGNVIVLYTPREESDECEDETLRISETGPASIGRRVSSPNGQQVAKGVCQDAGNGGGSGGGGGPVTYCLYLDWYDLYGNFLYSELVTCWEAAS